MRGAKFSLLHRMLGAKSTICANHTARVYEPTYPPHCEEEVNRAVHAVSTLFSIPLKDPSSGLYIAHKVRPETREDIVYSALRNSASSRGLPQQRQGQTQRP